VGAVRIRVFDVRGRLDSCRRLAHTADHDLHNFGERIARSIALNVADLLGGNIGFVQGLVNVGQDTVNSHIQPGIDEVHFVLPPLPPIPLAAKPATTPMTAVDTAKKAGGQTHPDPRTTPASEPSGATTQGDVTVM
jgi:hypothetical protein